MQYQSGSLIQFLDEFCHLITPVGIKVSKIVSTQDSSKTENHYSNQQMITVSNISLWIARALSALQALLKHPPASSFTSAELSAQPTLLRTLVPHHFLQYRGSLCAVSIALDPGFDPVPDSARNS
jgi:hypothetical protein